MYNDIEETRVYSSGQPHAGVGAAPRTSDRGAVGTPF